MRFSCSAKASTSCSFFEIRCRALSNSTSLFWLFVYGTLFECAAQLFAGTRYQLHFEILHRDRNRERMDVSYNSMSIRILKHVSKWPLPISKTIRWLTIATHDGEFHCDDALGVWLVKQTDRFRDASILGTRDSPLLDEADVVVDVGGVHDPRQLNIHPRASFGKDS